MGVCRLASAPPDRSGDFDMPGAPPAARSPAGLPAAWLTQGHGRLPSSGRPRGVVLCANDDETLLPGSSDPEDAKGYFRHVVGAIAAIEDVNREDRLLPERASAL